jgi:hypothetical protein
VLLIFKTLCGQYCDKNVKEVECKTYTLQDSPKRTVDHGIVSPAEKNVEGYVNFAANSSRLKTNIVAAYV